MSTSVHQRPISSNPHYSSNIPSSIDLINQSGSLFPPHPLSASQTSSSRSSTSMFDHSQPYNSTGTGGNLENSNVSNFFSMGGLARNNNATAVGSYASNNKIAEKNTGNPVSYMTLFQSITSYISYHSREDPTVNRLQQYIVSNHSDIVDCVAKRYMSSNNGAEGDVRMDNDLRQRIFHTICMEFKEILRKWCEQNGSPSSFWIYKNICEQFYGGSNMMENRENGHSSSSNRIMQQGSIYGGNGSRQSSSGGSSGSASSDRISPLHQLQQQQYAQQQLRTQFGGASVDMSSLSNLHPTSSPFARSVFPNQHNSQMTSSNNPFNMMQNSSYQIPHHPSMQQHINNAYQQQRNNGIREHSLFQSSNDDYPIDLSRIVQRKQPSSAQSSAMGPMNSLCTGGGECQSQQHHFDRGQQPFSQSNNHNGASSSDSNGSLFSTDAPRSGQNNPTQYTFQPPRTAQGMPSQMMPQQQPGSFRGMTNSFHMNPNTQNYNIPMQQQSTSMMCPPPVGFQPPVAMPTSSNHGAPQLNYPPNLQQQVTFNSMAQQQMASYCAQLQQQHKPSQQPTTHYAANYTANPKPLTKEKNSLASSSSEMPPLPQQHPDHHNPSFWLYNIGNTDFYITSNYEARNILGFGAYGIVISAHDSKSECEVAIKKQNLSNFGGNREYLKRLLREICILHHVDHPNLMCLVDLIPPFDFQHFESVYIVTQKMDHSLKDVIHSKQELKQEHVDFFMYQMTSAIRYLHACHLIHRDLKPENVLINDNCELRLSDFGLSKSIPLGLNPKNSTSIVSLFYRAPELLLGINQCSPSIDIWSLGTIFAEMYYPPRKPLFQSNSCYDALSKILALIGTPSMQDLEGLSDQISNEGYQYLTSLPYFKRRNFREVFPSASKDALDLIEKMLVFNPARRISAEEALRHPYFKDMDFHDEEFNFVCERMDTSWEEEFNDQKKNPKAILFKKIVEFNLQQNNCLVNGKYTILGEKHCVEIDTELDFD
uniref:Protein kinase domain-containing protein n=1 Tax=Percolomonas cosmopolitus TaxID=63605 RepID=A0A7S1KRE3_9EUKA|mmetsp:Transcript_6044/g.22858  ORF Transcript_6044/g.22858 Transcript_6044/m.22858 type:complete len:991 (+) Transcript_6044:1082-4054(+)|eukprot:CAMPEP_0117451734 /NCGR_PEP_ID=MMETSP0759-20121206/9173_1 /TAXON_ID=63605 /ORGANISM="Percolomonas cosmopolitus, Strain WS" /LENGTH=990 /DNA_ID=CAMNT_0005244369 /DNA_START=133 /DNA_END=3105 /DNA_ORIENTATION=-